MKKERFVHLVLAILGVSAVILNAMPNCVLMRFASDPWLVGPGLSYYEYCSGFSLLPVGYAIWGAMLAGIGAASLTILSCVGMIWDGTVLRKWQTAIAIISLLMILSLLLVGSMTLISGIIAVILASAAVFSLLNLNK